MWSCVPIVFFFSKQKASKNRAHPNRRFCQALIQRGTSSNARQDTLQHLDVGFLEGCCVFVGVGLFCNTHIDRQIRIPCRACVFRGRGTSRLSTVATAESRETATCISLDMTNSSAFVNKSGQTAPKYEYKKNMFLFLGTGQLRKQSYQDACE